MNKRKLSAMIISFVLVIAMTLSCAPALAEDIYVSSEDEASLLIENKEIADAEKPSGTVTFFPDGWTADIDLDSLRQGLFACTSAKEVEAYYSALNESEQEAFLQIVEEPEVVEFLDMLAEKEEIVVSAPPVNYMAVGHLLPAVQTPVQARKMMKSAAAPTSMAAGAGQGESGLELRKTASYDQETGKTKITMEAWTTGEVHSSSKSIPVDIVMVLDESGSMDEDVQTFTPVYSLNWTNSYYVKDGFSYKRVSYCLLCRSWASGWHFFGHHGTLYSPKTSANDSNSGHTQFYTRTNSGINRRTALIAAAQAFADKVNADAVNNSVDHRISVIGFNSSSSVKVGLSEDIRSNIVAVKNAIGGLDADGGTYIDAGLNNAKNVFNSAAQTDGTQRKRVVIVFTDGIPGTGAWRDDSSKNCANNAIGYAKELKETSGATVYTIGMVEGADPGLGVTDDEESDPMTNKFLHYLSSNYPHASSMSSGGTGGNSGYYLSASDTASLTSIFDKIAEEIEAPSIELDAQTIIKDTITPQFTAPSGASSISLYTDEYTGTRFANSRTAATGLTATVGNGVVSVSGFDFNKNFISATRKSDRTYGRKLIIEFYIEPRAEFLGGNDVTTNGTDSGVYDKENKSVGLFPVPSVNVPMKDMTVAAAEKNVYLLADLTAEQLKSDATVTVGGTESSSGIPLDLSMADDTATPYGLQPWQTAYVDISVTNVTAGIGDNSVTVYQAATDTSPEVSYNLTDLTDDTTYTVMVTMTPKTNGAKSSGDVQKAKSETSPEANINVFKPELTFKDLYVWYGDAAPTKSDLELASIGSEKWMHQKTDSTTYADDEGVQMTGTAPSLNMELTADEGKISEDGKINSKQDIPVNAAITVVTGDNARNITGNTVFKHQECDTETTCIWSDSTASGNPAFLLHPKTCQLTVEKTGGAEGESYVFKVIKGDVANAYTEVTITGNGNATIKGLPTGNYHVTEATGTGKWSWRYGIPTYDSERVTLNKNNPSGTITCTNTKGNNRWLNGYSRVESNIHGETHSANVSQ